jgi:hypothetical protein
MQLKKTAQVLAAVLTSGRIARGACDLNDR